MVRILVADDDRDDRRVGSAGVEAQPLELRAHVVARSAFRRSMRSGSSRITCSAASAAAALAGGMLALKISERAWCLM